MEADVMDVVTNRRVQGLKQPHTPISKGRHALFSVVYCVILVDLLQIGYWPQTSFATTSVNSLISYCAFAFGMMFLIWEFPRLRLPVGNTVSTLVLVLMAWAAFSSFASVDSLKSFQGLVKLFVYYMVINHLYSFDPLGAQSTLRSFIVAFLAINLVTVALAPEIGQEMQIASRAGSWRGLLPYKTQFGLTCAILFFSLYAQSAGRRDYLGTITMLGLLWCVYASGSRMTWGIVILGLAMFQSVKILRALPSRVRLSALFLGGSSAVALTPLVVVTVDSLLRGVGRDLTFSGRTAIWQYFINVADRSPYFGYGMGVSQQDREVLERAHFEMGWDAFASAHNSFIEWALNAGYFGALVFTLIVLGATFISMRSASELPRRCAGRNLALSGAVLVGASLTSSMSAASVLWLALFWILFDDLSDGEERGVTRSVENF